MIGLEQLGRLTQWVTMNLAYLPAAVLVPGRWWPHFYVALVGAMPVAIVAGAAMGLVAWLQLRELLGQFQSERLLPSALALSVIWEFGPVAAGLLAAGRLGAVLGAELAAMRNTEQLDAAQVLGVSIIPRLIAPRVLACVLALPLMTVFIDLTAIACSFLAEAMGGTMTWAEYQRECLAYLKLHDVIPATLKTMVFGAVIGLTGCYQGLHAQAGTEGVGRAATRAVVIATLLVMITDVFLVRIIQLFVN